MGRDPNDAAAAYPCPTPYKGHNDWNTVEGVTYKTWVGVFGHNDDLRWFAMSSADWFTIFRSRFFDKIHGSEFASLNVAAVITDIAFMSGLENAIKNLQRAANDVKGSEVLAEDGAIGPKTLAVVNSIDPVTLIRAIVNRRKVFLEAISKQGKNAGFLKGWLNRTDKYLTEFLIGLN